MERSQQKINLHYREKHGLLQCAQCDKQCNTVSALQKHAYDHSDKVGKQPCVDCDKSFPFASALKSHRKVHLTALEHHCLHCTKSFKNNGELVKHQAVHGNKEWTCQHPECPYVCHDPRNLCAHMHSHGDNTRYTCEKCKQGFNHYM